MPPWRQASPLLPLLPIIQRPDSDLLRLHKDAGEVKGHGSLDADQRRRLRVVGGHRGRVAVAIGHVGRVAGSVGGSVGGVVVDQDGVLLGLVADDFGVDEFGALWSLLEGFGGLGFLGGSLGGLTVVCLGGGGGGGGRQEGLG